MSEAKWKLMVDWSGNGEFAGADDDITPATLDLSLHHMRDLKTEYIDAARLDIRLANPDHRFSPPNSESPLFGSLKPGRKVWLRAAFPCDEFGVTPGTSLAGRAPEYGRAYRWTTTSNDFRIAANGGAQTNGTHTGQRIATMDLGLADVSFGCDFTRGSDTTRHGGLTLRYTDIDNFLYLRVTDSAVQVRKVENGADALLTETALQWNAGEKRFVQIELHGDLIRVFVDSQQVIATRSTFNDFKVGMSVEVFHRHCMCIRSQRPNLVSPWNFRLWWLNWIISTTVLLLISVAFQNNTKKSSVQIFCQVISVLCIRL